MIISVKVRASAKTSDIKQLSEDTFSISTPALPHDNQANLAAIKILSKHFRVPPSQITLIKGQKNKLKLFQIDG